MKGPLLLFLLSVAPAVAQVTLRGAGLQDLREQSRRIVASCDDHGLSIEYRQRFKNEGRVDRTVEVFVARPSMAETTAPMVSLAGAAYRPLPALPVTTSAPETTTSTDSPAPPLRARLVPFRTWTLEGRRNLNVRSRHRLPAPFDARGNGLLRIPLLLRLPTRRADFVDRVHLDLDLGDAPPLLLSLSHPLHLRRRGRRTLRATWTETDHCFHSDLLLLGAEAGPSPGALLLPLVHGPTARRRRHLVVLPRTALPEAPPFGAPSKTVIFLLDVTGSMRGNRLHALKKAVGKLVADLDERDRFNLIAFSAGTQSLFHDVQAASPGAKARARTFLDGLHGDGACNLDEGLLVALENLSPPPSTERVALCLITDGRPTMGQTDPTGILRNVRAFAPKGVRIHVACLGMGADLLTAEALAEATGGRVVSSPDGGDLEAFFRRSIATPPCRIRLASRTLPLPEHELSPRIVFASDEGPILLALTCQGPLPEGDLELRLRCDDGRDGLRALPLHRSSPALRAVLRSVPGPLLRLHHALRLAPRLASLRHGEDPAEALKSFSHAERLLLAACFGCAAEGGDGALALALTDGLGPAALRRLRWMRSFERRGLWIPVDPGRPLALPFGGPALVWDRGRYVDVRLGPKARPSRRVAPGAPRHRELLGASPWLAEAECLGAEILFLPEGGKGSLLLSR